ncbi:MAG: (deoxy)nucleoside triphosphate pyrophosphohydrolase [Terrisporobacter sp.]|uniref:(deoxy)nucleoside triphosphate pyrophosphohydrolase n=1 Tax=Terrisporobacter sp. TaxID=1965305 RepID=UPI002FC68334
MKKKIKVVAAIIENNVGEILCALRSSNMSMPNCWEFPGGKVENGESLYDAIEREIKEELLCRVKAVDVFNDSTYEYDDIIVNLVCIKCELVDGNPVATEHAKIIWLNRENLNSLKWAPADVSSIEMLVKE